MALDLPPMRSLQDFLTAAQFTAPTFDDLERMSNRMANNLLYYQTNYFLLAIVIFLIVGCMYPKDLILGALSVVAASFLYKALVNKKDPVLGLAVLLGLVVVLCLFSSILVFMFGVTMPIGVVLLHSACRKRNLKNKVANVMTELKDNTTPMALILNVLYQLEDEVGHRTSNVPG